MTQHLILLGVVGVILAWWVVRSPSTAWARLSGLLRRGKPSWTVVSRESKRLQPQLRQELERFDAAFAELGFEPLAWVRLDAVGLLTWHHAIATDGGFTTGVGTIFRVPSTGTPPQVEFVTRFGAGASLHTNNGPQQLPPVQGMRVLQYPECRNALALLRIHLALVQVDGRTPLPVATSVEELRAQDREDEAARAGDRFDIRAYRAQPRDEHGRIIARDEEARLALEQVGLSELWKTEA